MGEYYGGDVGVFDPSVYKANTGVVYDNDGVRASRGNVENNIIRVIVYTISTISMRRCNISWAGLLTVKSFSVHPLGGESIDENQTGITCLVYLRFSRVKIREQLESIGVGSLLKSIKWS